jgi:hypothetical protein
MGATSRTIVRCTPAALTNEAASTPQNVAAYRPELTTCELIVEVRRWLAVERGASHLVCRYLADLADRVRRHLDPALDRYRDELDAARCFFDLNPRETRERVRIGRALRELPALECAFSTGELSYSRVREITRIATLATEAEWLALAQRVDMRTLERRVAEAAAPRSGQSEQRAADTSLTTSRITFELSEPARAVLERALESVRRASGHELSDAEALEAMARAALSTPDTPSTQTTQTTQGGSSNDDIESRVLRTMAHARRWSTEKLIEASGLSAREVQTALTFLELGGRVRRRADAFEPV